MSARLKKICPAASRKNKNTTIFDDHQNSYIEYIKKYAYTTPLPPGQIGPPLQQYALKNTFFFVSRVIFSRWLRPLKLQNTFYINCFVVPQLPQVLL